MVHSRAIESGLPAEFRTRASGLTVSERAYAAGVNLTNEERQFSGIGAARW